MKGKLLMKLTVYFVVLAAPVVAPHVPSGWFRVEPCDLVSICTVSIFWMVGLDSFHVELASVASSTHLDGKFR